MVNLDLEKNIQSKKLFERAKQALPGGVNSPVRAFAPNPFFVTHANGSKIFDVDNQEYIDGSPEKLQRIVQHRQHFA